MRLTVFGPGFPLRGGIASTTTALVRALEERGHQVQFLTPRRQYPRWLYPGGDERDPEACPPVAGAQVLFAPLEPWTWRRARRRALDFGADAWIIPYWTWAWAPLWWFLLRGRSRGCAEMPGRDEVPGMSPDVSHADQGRPEDRPGVSRPPAIAVVHNVHDHGAGAIRRWAARRIFARCQGFLTHAEFLKVALEEEFPETPVTAYPLPAVASERPMPQRNAARRGMDIGPEERLALFVGLIRPYKGVDVLIEAFARLPKTSKWRLVIAGEPWGGLDQVLSAQVEALGLGDRVRLHFGWVPEGEVDRLLIAADVLVLPYRSGTQSAMAPMALSRGLPVLSTDVGGLGEVIEHRVSGLLVEPDSPQALAQALATLEGESLAGLAAGAAAAAGRWTWAGYAEALKGLIDGLRPGGALASPGYKKAHRDGGP